MGEILRAVCDATCLDSRPAFYSASVTTTSTGPLARALGRRQAVIQCKADTWFLMMAWSIDVALGAAAPPFYESKTYPAQFMVRDLRNTQALGNFPAMLMHSNSGYNLNNIVPLPHYHLWEPGALLGLEIDAPIQNPVATIQAQTFVTLTGIEYQMPPGKDLS